jgi:hypothetical protein
MGRSFIATYVGAYFKVDMPNDDFSEILDEVNFDSDEPKFKHFFYENFQRPYEGLERVPILLPHDRDESLPVAIGIEVDEEGEHEFNSVAAEQFTENLKKTYLPEIAAMKVIFGDKLKIRFGVVNYRDEMA